MERITQFRARMILLLFGLILVFFAFRLYDVQIIQTGGNMDNSSTFTTLTTVKAARGDILDTNGNVLVSNRASYDLVINPFVLLSADGTTNYLYQLAQRCEEAGIEYNEHFPVSETRPFTYTLDKINTAWQGYFQTYLVKALNMDSDVTAPLLMQRMRRICGIPAEWSDEVARKVIGLYYELGLRRYVPSLPNYLFLSDASDEALSTIVELNIPGLNVEASTVREYSTAYASHILGYVGPMDGKQWDKYKDIKGYDMDAEIGQAGLEAVYEQYLHGINGLREDTVTKDGTLISSHYIKEPQAGSNVEISIDINLQRVAEDSMKKVLEQLHALPENADGHDAQGGAVVAINVKTGQVLVCASYPTYDLSTFFEDYNEILHTPFDPLFNRALEGQYPPGSTYKMSMVIAGIDSGIINSTTQIEDKGVFEKGELQVSCLMWSSYGLVHVGEKSGGLVAKEALMDSCNYFFYALGDQISLSAMDDTAKGLGLGEHTGIELYERIGHRANAETKALLYTPESGNSGWNPGDQILAAIGQSENLFTPMQLCVYASTLANRGIRYKATFMNRVVSSDYRTLLQDSHKEVLSQMDISDDAFQAYTEGMHLVATNGTAAQTFRNYPIAVAAKTGTAQNGAGIGASDHGAFICYAPLDNPEIAIAIYGERAGHGSSLATIAKAMLDVYFEVGDIGDVNTFENKLS